MVRVGLFESLVYQGTLSKIRRSGIGCETGCGTEDPLRLFALFVIEIQIVRLKFDM